MEQFMNEGNERTLTDGNFSNAYFSRYETSDKYYKNE